MHDAHAVNSLVETPGADPVAGRVRWAPVQSLWNGGMAAAALVLGPLTFSWPALGVFVLSTGAVLLLGHSVGFHRRLIHRSFGCPLWLERVLVWFGTAGGVGGPAGIGRPPHLRAWGGGDP